MRRNRGLSSFLVVLVVLSGCIIISPTAGAGESCADNSVAESRLVRRINSFRSAHDLPLLRIDRDLSLVASVHSREIAARRDSEPMSQQILQERVTSWSILGESAVDSDELDGVIRRLTRMTVHSRLMLYRRFTFVGVGVTWAGGRAWTDVIYSGARDPGTTLKSC
jgi:hypothetical protein